MKSVGAHGFGVLATALVVASLSGCQGPCDSGPKPAEDFFGGTTDLERGVYESVSWRGQFLEFDPQRRYRFFHKLGGVPRVLQPWISFEPKPLPDGALGNVSEGVGNEAIIEAVTNEYVVIRNDTCGEFYLRFVASDPVSE